MVMIIYGDDSWLECDDLWWWWYKIVEDVIIDDK